MTTKAQQAEFIHVGKVSDDIFIGCPDSMYERALTTLTEAAIHTMRLSRDDAAWLIRALKKELREPRP